MPALFIMGAVDVVAAFMLWDAGFGELGFYIALALVLKGGMSLLSSTLLQSVLSGTIT